MEGESETALGQQPDSEQSGPDAAGKKSPRYGRRVLVATVIGGALIALAQLIAPATDHQYANFASGAVGVTTVVYILFQAHAVAVERGRRKLIPAAVLVLIGLLVTLLQFDGFSGEMMPQFKFRFAGPSHQLRSVDPQASVPPLASPDSNRLATAAADSLGFLGNDRTGVIMDRLFKVPTGAAEIENLWDQGIGQGWSSFSVAGDRAVTLEQREDRECVTCYRLLDGQLLWMQSHEARHENALGGVGPRSTPTIVDGRVYAQGATGRVWCLDLQTGDVVWTVDLLALAGWDQIESETLILWGRAGSPLIVDGLCVVPFGGPEENQETGRSLIALDVTSGQTRWTAGEDQISFASPGLLSFDGVPQIVSVNETTITGHAIDDGTPQWEFEWLGQSNGPANCSMVVPAGDNRFLIGKGYGGGSALVEVTRDAEEGWTATSIWSKSLLKTKFTHACILENRVAFGISNGSLEAVALDEGRAMWRQPRGSRFGQGQILLVDDTIVAQSEQGEVVFVAADPSQYRELLRVPALKSKTWNIPTIAGRHLLARNDRQAVCFVLPKP